MQDVRPKKGLGQHFLTDRNIATKIVGSLLPGNNKTLIEVGPGKGILTGYLLERNEIDFITVELDKESIAYLNTAYPDHTGKFILGDFLKFPLKDLKVPIAIIGNFPYNISSQIFFYVLEHRNIVSQVVCMIQKEVAERISTGPGSKKYGILSVLLQAYYNIEYLFTVNEKCFMPPPKVKSAVIRLTRNDRKEMECNPTVFFKIVKAAFNQRRKTIRNSLRNQYNNLPLDNILLTMRPEQLTVEQFEELTQRISHLNSD